VAIEADASPPLVVASWWLGPMSVACTCLETDDRG